MQTQSHRVVPAQAGPHPPLIWFDRLTTSGHTLTIAMPAKAGIQRGGGIGRVGGQVSNLPPYDYDVALCAQPYFLRKRIPYSDTGQESRL